MNTIRGVNTISNKVILSSKVISEVILFILFEIVRMCVVSFLSLLQKYHNDNKFKVSYTDKVLVEHFKEAWELDVIVPKKKAFKSFIDASLLEECNKGPSRKVSRKVSCKKLTYIMPIELNLDIPKVSLGEVVMLPKKEAFKSFIDASLLEECNHKGPSRKVSCKKLTYIMPIELNLDIPKVSLGEVVMLRSILPNEISKNHVEMITEIIGEKLEEILEEKVNVIENENENEEEIEFQKTFQRQYYDYETVSQTRKSKISTKPAKISKHPIKKEFKMFPSRKAI